MKKRTWGLLTALALTVIGVVISIIIYCSMTDTLYMYMTYDHVRCNGFDYYRAEDQSYYSPFWTKDLPAYIVDSRGRVRYDCEYYADGFGEYEGDERYMYIFFDSAIYTRELSLMNPQIRKRLECRNN